MWQGVELGLPMDNLIVGSNQQSAVSKPQLVVGRPGWKKEGRGRGARDTHSKMCQKLSRTWPQGAGGGAGGVRPSGWLARALQREESRA